MTISFSRNNEWKILPCVKPKNIETTDVSWRIPRSKCRAPQYKSFSQPLSRNLTNLESPRTIAAPDARKENANRRRVKMVNGFTNAVDPPSSYFIFFNSMCIEECEKISSDRADLYVGYTLSLQGRTSGRKNCVDKWWRDIYVRKP